MTYVSQDPRPADGRVSILAFAIGEESFLDGNADGIFNTGLPPAPADVPIEIGEPFRADDED